MHQSSFHRMKRFADTVRDQYQGRPVRVLDVGSQGVNGTYRELFRFPGASYQGLDIAPGPNVDVVPQNPYAWAEIADQSFDVIISGQALEHVEFPWLTMEQIARKLRPGGLCCLVVPSRGPEHRYPVDCYRFYPDGLRALARWAGLRVLEVDYVRDPSGFSDDSDRWGDCHCVLARDHAHDPPAAPPTHAPRPAQGRTAPRHRHSPFHRPPSAQYFHQVRPEVLQLIDKAGLRPSRVLELGCGGGATSRAIKDRTGAYCVGIEGHEEAAQAARAHLDQVLVADLDRLPTPPQAPFDLLLCLDVLEHLYDPWAVLSRYVELLRPGGHALLSLPNVQNISVLLGLSQGQWAYQAEGILDATHLRFFTLPSAEHLVTGAGLKLLTVTNLLSPPLDLGQLRPEGNLIGNERLRIGGLTRDEVLCFFTFQYLLLAQRE